MDIETAERKLNGNDGEPVVGQEQQQPVEQQLQQPDVLQDAEAERQRKLDTIFKPRQRMSIQYIKGQLRKFLDSEDNQRDFLKHRLKPGAKANSTNPADQLSYLSWDDCVKIMDRVTRSMWSFTMPFPIAYSPNGLKVTVSGRVTIYAAEGDFQFDDIGCGWSPIEEFDPNLEITLSPLWYPAVDWNFKGYPKPPLKTAEGKQVYQKKGQGFDEEIKAKQQAWKRCLAQCGLALDLYDADFVKELQEQSE